MFIRGSLEGVNYRRREKVKSGFKTDPRNNAAGNQVKRGPEQPAAQFCQVLRQLRSFFVICGR
jgi:hypothetical protein